MVEEDGDGEARHLGEHLVLRRQRVDCTRSFTFGTKHLETVVRMLLCTMLKELQQLYFPHGPQYSQGLTYA